MADGGAHRAGTRGHSRPGHRDLPPRHPEPSRPPRRGPCGAGPKLRRVTMRHGIRHVSKKGFNLHPTPSMPCNIALEAGLKAKTSMAASDGADLNKALQACARGDRAALRAIYDAEAPRMLGVAQRLLRRPALAEEAVQDAFVQV